MADSQPTVAAVQLSVDDLAVEHNVDRVRDRVVDLPNRVDIAVCPEHTLTGFVDDDRLGQAALPRSDALNRLKSIATDGDVAIVAGYVEDGGDGDLYNATAYVPPAGNGGGGATAREGSRAATSASGPVVYRKRHLWGGEQERLSPGTDRVIVETPAGSTGLLTCYDLNFVGESAWFTERAIDALFVPGAWPAAHTANWRLLLRARALDGVRWVVGTGRTGDTAALNDDDSGESERVNEETRYAGNSLVARPDGGVAAALGHEERDLLATLDQSVLDRQRELVGSVPPDQNI